MLTHRVYDGDKKARSPERARRKPLKPFARGKPDLPARTCGDFARVLFCFCARGCGCAIGIRLSLRPLLLRDEVNRKARAKFVARTKGRISMSKMPALTVTRQKCTPDSSRTLVLASFSRKGSKWSREPNRGRVDRSSRCEGINSGELMSKNDWQS